MNGHEFVITILSIVIAFLVMTTAALVRSNRELLRRAYRAEGRLAGIHGDGSRIERRRTRDAEGSGPEDGRTDQG